MRIRPFCFLIASVLVSSTASSQTLLGERARQRVNESEEIHYKENGKLPDYLKLEGSQNVLVEQFPDWVKKNFKLDARNDFAKVTSVSDALGYRHYKFQQTYNSVPVDGAVYIAHTKEGKVYSMNGNIADIRNFSTVPVLSERSALQRALHKINAKKYKWEDVVEETHLKKVTGNPMATYFPKGELVVRKTDNASNEYRLVYKFDIYSEKPHDRVNIYIDAVSGKVVEEISLICYIGGKAHIHEEKNKDTKDVHQLEKSLADATGTANTRYSGTRQITAESFSGGYRLRESGRGSGIETYNMNENYKDDYAVDFTDSDNSWDAASEQDKAAFDAHWGAESVYDYFYTIHGWDSYDNQGTKVLSYVHFGDGYDNAFWNGYSMNYGDGSNKSGGFTSLTTLDVVGHEFAHGVTMFSANLQYNGESGALNESFSDIFGSLLEFEYKPEVANYLIAEQAMFGGGFLRSMNNPNAGNQPDTYKGLNWSESGAVHTNSGVGNFWFYLLAEGGSGVNDNGDSYAVTGIGKQKAAKIAFRNLSVYLTSRSDFEDARYFSIKAAVDLYGPCSPEVEAVTRAWYAVGVGSQYSSNASADFKARDTTFCTLSSAVHFKNLSYNATHYLWDFGDGTTSMEEHPVHTYSSFGKFTVSLQASGGSCGTGTVTKTEYIEVSDDEDCVEYLKIPEEGEVVQTACSGTFYDDGGPDANYNNNTAGLLTLQPENAVAIKLTFHSFDVKPGDMFILIDGPDGEGEVIDWFKGTDLPLGGVFYSSGNVLALRQTTNASETAAGFEVSWQCITANDPPVARSIIKNPACGGTVYFEDNSVNNPTSWHWNFGDGTTSNEQNPVKKYTSAGTYDVSLEVCNGAGCDSYLYYAAVNINLDPACFITMPFFGFAETELACSGILKDDGGDGDFSNDSWGELTISPPGANAVVLEFTKFSFGETNDDYLYIYDGPSFASPLIGVFTGTSLPNGGTIVSSTGSITLMQSTGFDGTSEGFECTWHCLNNSDVPKASFVGYPRKTCDGNVLFTDGSVNNATSWEWNFGDGSTSLEQSPLKKYVSDGVYTVTLKVCNDNGCDELVLSDYITVQKESPCSVLVPVKGTGPVQTACTGILKDDGGDENYSHNSDGYITIAPEGASTVTLTFTTFEFETGWDQLIIYDGPSIESPVLGVFSGTTLPNGGSITSTGGAITIQQNSDEVGHWDGFECTWECEIINGINDAVKGTSELVKVYPQPASEETMIQFEFEGKKNLTVYMMDVLQQVVYQEKGSYTGEYTKTIDVSVLSKGIYFIYIDDGEQVVVKKLIVV